MQTFLPYPNFKASAFALDSKRLGKQRVENMQIMSAILSLKLENTYKMVQTGSKIFYYDEFDFEVDELDLEPNVEYKRVMEPTYKRVERPYEDWVVVEVKNPGWENHPVTRMWRGYEWALLNYQKAVVDEWESRGHHDTCFLKTFTLYFHDLSRVSTNDLPPWFGSRAVHRAHKSNLIRKDPKYYGPMFPGVPDHLPYIYPPRKK